jgi:hypothetical protein
VAEEYNSIGIVAEESGESIHNRWNNLMRRFGNQRGETRERGAVLELERSQEPRTRDWIGRMVAATKRVSAGQQAQATEEEEEENTTHVSVEQDVNEEGEEEEEQVANDDNAHDTDNELDNDDDVSLVLEQCNICKQYFPTEYIPLHTRHDHSPDNPTNTSRQIKSQI